MALLRVHSDYPSDILCAVDEASRGCLIGPVAAAAVIWPADFEHDSIKYIKDSKKLSKKKRKEMQSFITEHAVAYAVSMVDEKTIDEINIRNATFKAMHDCIKEIERKQIHFDRILIDGNAFNGYISKTKGFIPHTCVTKGDNTYISIAAASILAKNTRDEYMDILCDQEPELER